MGQKKGQTGNPKGRPKGTPNKVTSNIKDWLSELIDKNRMQIEKDLKALEPKERLQMLEKLMGYIVPKMQAVQADVSIDRLTEEQVGDVVDKLLNKLEDNEDCD